jgi:hypothetical protein
MFSPHQCLGILSLGSFLLLALQMLTGISFR